MGHLSSVNYKVRLQVIQVRESFLTLRTMIWDLFLERTFVSAKVLIINKGLSTVKAHALVHAHMTMNVVCYILIVIKGFTALGTSKWHFHVALHMSLED